MVNHWYIYREIPDGYSLYDKDSPTAGFFGNKNHRHDQHQHQHQHPCLEFLYAAVEPIKKGIVKLLTWLSMLKHGTLGPGLYRAG